MLVLTRKNNQEICLPDLGIKFKVLNIKGSAVRIGIDAPDDVHILRGELNGFRETLSSEAMVSGGEKKDFEYQVA